VLAAVVTACMVFAPAMHGVHAGHSTASDFWFVYETAYGDRVDTRRGLVTKDLVGAPDTTIALRLSDAELARIEQLMRQGGLAGFKEPHPDLAPTVRVRGGIPGDAAPSTACRLEFQLDGRQVRLQWSTAPFMRETTPQWKALFRVERAIRETVEARPEYRRLPRPVGGYA